MLGTWSDRSRAGSVLAYIALQPLTTMEFRTDDGTPYPQTINGETASDWMLIVDPANSELRKWVPFP